MTLRPAHQIGGAHTKGHNEVITSTKKRGLLVAGAIVAGATLLAGCAAGAAPADEAGSAGLESGFGSRAENRDVYFFTYYNPAGDAFWAQILQGAEDAAELGNLEFTHQTAEGDSATMVTLVQTAIATDPAFIFMPFNEGEAWVDVACQAHDAGIPVIAFNVPAPESAGDCVQGFVGQDFYEVGTIVAQNLLDSGVVAPGDKVLITAEEPDQPYAFQRGGGVYDVLSEAGIGVLPQPEWLRTGGEDAPALDALTTWLVANPDVKAIVPVGGTPHRNLPAALLAAGNTTAKVIGFDTAPAIVQGLKDGQILATADQQGYIQGFQSVMQGILNLDFGFSAANINSGGLGLITKDTVSNIEAPDLQGIRW
ncbi:MAG: substrate-binding domain-containing protein [Yonghaparkia sp.]|nr:substrate-binding domain-containing protein [Microcella sp.]